MKPLLPYGDRLLSELSRGDTSAFDQIFNTYYDRLLVFARRFVELETAEDILTETFLKLWQTSGCFSSLAGLEQWLRVTTRNACIDHLRKIHRISENIDTYQYVSEQHWNDIYFRTGLEAALYSRIVAEIEKLPSLTSNVLKLSFLEGLTVDEIALRLNIKRQVVYNRRSLGIKELRSALSEQDLAIGSTLLSLLLPEIF